MTARRRVVLALVLVLVLVLVLGLLFAFFLLPRTESYLVWRHRDQPDDLFVRLQTAPPEDRPKLARAIHQIALEWAAAGDQPGLRESAAEILGEGGHVRDLDRERARGARRALAALLADPEPRVRRRALMAADPAAFRAALAAEAPDDAARAAAYDAAAAACKARIDKEMEQP